LTAGVDWRTVVNLNKSTLYALYAAVEMARLEGNNTVTVAEVAARHDVSEGVLAKVLQQLVRVGIAIGTRGVGGGYRLARDPSTLSVLDIIDLFEPHRDPLGAATSSGPTDASSEHRLHRLFTEVDQLARNTYASTSLETLVR